MKKLILLLAAGFTGAASFAQENSSVLFSSTSAQSLVLAPHQLVDPATRAQLSNRNLSNVNAENQRTTSPHPHSYAEWFSYWDENSTSTSILYYWSTAADSNIYDMSGSSSFNIFTHGLGQSFDPTDLGYYGAPYGSGLNSPLDSAMTDNNAYIVDSFDVPFKYVRNNNTSAAADSIIIEFTVTTLGTTDSGTFKLRYPASSANTAITSDSTPRFATGTYTRLASGLGPNEMYDSIIAPKYRYAFPLVLADTVGTIEERFAVNIPVEAKQKVISFVHFKSSSATTLGSSSGGSTSNNSNFLHLFAGTTGTTTAQWPGQTPHNGTVYAGSYQTGLIAQNQIRYEDTGFTFGHHNLLIPGVAFSTADLAVTLQSFHLKWVGMLEDAVVNVNKTISNAVAVPNPASSFVNVNFNLSVNADATVTLTNTVGQVVATEVVSNVTSGHASFNTSVLPTGVYFYTVTANGEHTTGRVAIAH